MGAPAMKLVGTRSHVVGTADPSTKRMTRLQAEQWRQVTPGAAFTASPKVPFTSTRSRGVSEAGAPPQAEMRDRDGANTWPCALQVRRCISARRLHCWRVPGAEGATIEFASVGVHDDMEIPE